MSDRPLVLGWATVRHAAFPDRVAAAAAAGYDAIGLRVETYQAMVAQGWTDREIDAVLRDHDQRIDEVEVIFGFCGPPGPAGIAERPWLVYADPAAERVAFHLADTFGARRVHVMGTFDRAPVDGRTVAAFAALCDRAAAHGMQVALEPVPYTNIPDVRCAAEVVRAAGRPNGGLCVDSWHFHRGSADLDDLAAVEGDQVLVIQINDGPATPVDPTPMIDSIHHRRCPGEGAFDLAGFLAALERPGVAVPLSVEIFDDRLDRLPAATSAARAAAATRSLLRA